MKASYNVTGDERKALVKVIGETLGIKPAYLRMPTCAYKIGDATVEKDGTMVWDGHTDEATIAKVTAALEAAGFTAEDATEEAGLTVSVPRGGFTETGLDNLKKLVDSKAALIRKALAADRLDIEADGETVAFPWWDRTPEPDEARSYTAFIVALCKMAKEAKRVTAKETEVESEKYAFRCFLLRLGFIGADSKAQRRILMRRLTGSAAFPTREKAEAFNAAQREKAQKAKEVRS